IETICGIICMPVELALRPLFGTRYFPLPVSFFSMILMVFLPFMSATATAVVGMIPFHHSAPVAGLFGIGAFSYLYFLALTVHGFRVWRRMIYMDRERLSTFEGPPLFFFRFLPKSDSFWVPRIFYEPIFVCFLTFVLEHTFIIQSALATYLYLAAFALGVKEFCVWYRVWEFLRNMKDAAAVGPIVSRMSRGEATNDELASIHLASLPKNIPSDLRKSLAEHIRRIIAPASKQDE
ncbi:MAG: hypothetical protein WA655_24945, partial [Candidatus Korobacteraceae bacterium]